MEIKLSEKHIITVLALVLLSVVVFFATPYLYGEYVYKPIYIQGQADILNRIISEKKITFVNGNVVFYSDMGCQEQCLNFIDSLMNNTEAED